jgi:para-nitrobenzyl esterase
MKYFNLLMLFSSSLTAFSQCDGRYETEIFEQISLTEVEYTDVHNWSASNSGLDMDIYQPVGDEFTERPVLIFAHGGSFYAGDKDSPDMVALCESFAKRGYVTASIQYRLTNQLSLLDSNAMIQTVFNAISDMKSSVRYFRKDFEINNNSLKIDTSQIFVGGYSAGAILAVNLGFFNNEDEIPAYLQPIVTNAGGIEGNSGNDGYSSRVSAIINLAGAVYLPSFIDSSDIPIVSIHAVDDETVAYDCGNALGISFLPILCGSEKIHELAEAALLDNEIYTFLSGGHSAPIVNLLEVSIPFVGDFIYDQLDCNDATLVVQNEEVFTAFPNPFDDHFLIKTNDHITDIRLLDIVGNVHFVWHGNSSSIRLNLSKLPSGIYFMQYAQNGTFKVKRVIKR